MDQLAGVLLQVDALDAYRVRLSVIPCNLQVAVFAEGPFILGNLVAFGQVRIEIVFAGKPGDAVDGAVEGKACPYAVFHGLLVQHRKGARLSGTYRTDIGVGSGVITHRAITEEFCPGVKLNMCLEAYDEFVIH